MAVIQKKKKSILENKISTVCITGKKPLLILSQLLSQKKIIFNNQPLRAVTGTSEIFAKDFKNFDVFLRFAL